MTEIEREIRSSEGDHVWETFWNRIRPEYGLVRSTETDEQWEKIVRNAYSAYIERRSKEDAAEYARLLNNGIDQETCDAILEAACVAEISMDQAATVWDFFDYNREGYGSAH